MATRTTGRSASTDGASRTAGTTPERSDRPERREKSRPAAERNARFHALQSLFRDTVTEVKKVSWPDQQTTRNLTIVVIGTAVALGALLGGIDAFFARVWQWIP